MQASGNLERRKSTGGIAAEVIRTGRLALLDLPEIVGGHRLDARVRFFSPDDTARPNANHRAGVGDAARRGQDFDEVPANAMDEEDRRLAASRLERDQRRRTWCAPLSQGLAKLTEPRRLADQRERDLESQHPLEFEHERDGPERVAAAVEKIIISCANGYEQYLLPDACHGLRDVIVDADRRGRGFVDRFGTFPVDVGRVQRSERA